MASDKDPVQPQVPPSGGNWSYPQYAHQSDIRLSELIGTFYARRYLIATVSLLLAALAAGGSYLLRPTFLAEVLMVPVSEQRPAFAALGGQFGGLAELAGLNLGGGGNTAAAIATLKSRALTEAFITDWNLLPIIFEEAWDPDNKRWKAKDPSGAPALWDAYRRFDRNIRKIQQDRKSGLVTLSIEWRDPKAAASWANELVKRANAKLQQDTIDEGRRTISFLEQQLGKAAVLEVRQALYSLIEVETKNIAVASARAEFAFKIIDGAVVPQRKHKPNRTLITLVAFFLGLIGSAFAAFLMGPPMDQEG